MSVIIRLQNLPWSANALDIRQYFQGLSIPEGGVHIVGGELGDAFIAFSTDEDARQAMLIDGGKIKEVKIKLFLSSRSEMQKVIETARAQSITMQTFMQLPPAQIPSAPVPATQIPPTPSQTTPAMPPISQMAVRATPEVKLPPLPSLLSLPVETPAPEAIKSEPELEKKDQDTESVSSKDTKRGRRGRSKSKSKDRSKSRSRSRDRNYRSKDRYRDRRRRDRSRSRDRRDRRRYRDRSRSRDRNAHKVSRDRRRDPDRNSSEKNITTTNIKNVTVPEKEVESTIPPMSSKPGFTNSGWVPAGSTEISGSPLTNPIGFSIGKPLLNSSTSNQTQSPKSEISTSLKIPLPQQSLPLPTPQQMPTSQSDPSSQPLVLPHPPPFPQMPLEVSKDESGQLKSIPFPPNQPQSTNPITTQHGTMFPPIQPPLLQSEANKMIPGPPFMMPPGWNPNMLPMVGNPHLLLGPMPPPTVGINNADKPPMPMMNVPMGMYLRPPDLPSSENVQPPHLQNDPRVQSGFNMQQQRNDFRDNNSVPQNNFNSQKQSNFTEGRVNITNKKNTFLNTSVEIRNMSMSTTNIDIRRFFQGLQIPADGVKIITDKKGNKVGMAYVRFSKSFFKDMALKKSGQLLKNSIVEVLHIDDSIFDKANDFADYPGNFYKDNQNYKGNFDSFVASNEPTETYTDLTIHEVPPFAKDRDIYNLFKGFNIEDAFVLLRTGRKTATGYVRFRTPAEAHRAMATSSRLSIGYTNVKVAICYEHEFSEARDRKNMEEDDEEMMDSKDGGSYPIHENRGPRGSKKYSSYDYEEEESNSKYSQIEKRPFNKALLPTPLIKPFDQRPSLGNQSNNSHSFNSRYDRRQLDSSRTSKDFHKKPYTREDFHQQAHIKESSRFQTRQPPRDEYGENRYSVGEINKKSSFQDQSRKPLLHQPPFNTPSTNKDVKEPAVSLKSTPINSANTVSNEKEVKVDETNKSEADKKDVKQNPKSPQKSSTAQPDVQKLQEEEKTEPKQNEKAIDEAKQNNQQTVEKEKQINHGTDCIIMRGLPFNANDRDILDFFSDEGLVPTQIHIMLDKLGQPAGDAFCEFNTTDEVSRALTKSKTLMGRSVVSVDPVSREEMLTALGVIVAMHAQELAEQEFEEYEAPERLPHQEYRRPEFRFPPRGRGFPHFPPRGRGRGGFRIRHHAPTEMELESQNVNSFGKPGCVLALENVPFRAEVQDILDFFKGYFVSRDNVIRRFDENGKPTGDARVCLNSPEDANHAFRVLNQRQIYNRQIHLSLV